MNLDRVTITGADDSVNQPDLVELSKEFPFVEWGILFSKNHQGKPRWASYSWLEVLFANDYAPNMKFAAHLCGKWVKELVKEGNPTFALTNPNLWVNFQRVQLNFHGDKYFPNLNFEAAIKDDGKEYIFQYDGVNDVLNSLKSKNKGFPLFDISGGNGILPDKWPAPFSIYNGYAGGLGPENIKEQIEKIKSVTGNARIWIDMETRVRSDDDRILDLNKVRKCLEISSEYIK